MRFAYMIMAHNSYELLKELIKTLDFPENDIYIHLDLKLGNVDLQQFVGLTKYSKVSFLKNRVDVQWGRVSIVEATMNLLEESIKGRYDYYHILSGVDFPIKSNKYIKDFFEKNKGKEFIGFRPELKQKDVSERIAYYHFVNGNSYRNSWLMHKINTLLIYIQKIFYIRHYYNIECFKIGPAWFSITDSLARDLVSKKNTILHKYKYVKLPDEMFIQSFVYGTDYMNRIYKLDEQYQSCLRKIDWERGDPYVWMPEDFDELIESSYLYARKFSEKNIDFIRRIRHSLSE